MFVPVPRELTPNQQKVWLAVLVRAVLLFLPLATCLETICQWAVFLALARQSWKFNILGICHYLWLSMIKGCVFLGSMAVGASNLTILRLIYIPSLVISYMATTVLAIGDLVLFSQTRRHIYDPLFTTIVNNPKLFYANIAPTFGDFVTVIFLLGASGAGFFMLWKVTFRELLPRYSDLMSGRRVVLSLAVFIMLLVSISFVYAKLGTIEDEETELAQCQNFEVLPFFPSVFCSFQMDVKGSNDFRTDIQRNAPAKLRHRKAIARPRHRPDILLLIWDSIPENTVTSDVAPHMRRFIDEEANLVVKRYVTSAGLTEMAFWSLLYGMQPDSRAILDYDSFKTSSFYLDALKAIGYDVYWCMTGYSDYWWAYGRNLKHFGHGQFGDNIRVMHEDPVSRLSDPLTAGEVVHLMTDPLRKRPIFVLGVFGCTHWPYFFFRENAKYPKAALRSPEAHTNALADGDKLFDAIVTELKRQNKWNNTIVMLSADHGEGVHSTTHRGHMPRTPLGLSSNQQLLLPFGMRVPAYLLESRNLSTTRLEPEVGSHVDIMPTIFDLLNVDSRPWTDTNGQESFEFEEELIRGMLSGVSLYRQNKSHWTYSYQVTYPTTHSQMSLLFVTSTFKVHYVTNDVCTFTTCELRRVYPHQVEVWSDSDGKLTSASEEELQVVDRMFLYYMDTVEVPLSKLILERRLK